MISSIALPLVIAVVGGCYNVNMKNSENRVRYVELAIAQLRAPPTPETSALREWAVGLLDSQAPSNCQQQNSSSCQPAVSSLRVLLPPSRQGQV
jgi:hypothetical protein